MLKGSTFWKTATGCLQKRRNWIWSEWQDLYRSICNQLLHFFFLIWKIKTPSLKLKGLRVNVWPRSLIYPGVTLTWPGRQTSYSLARHHFESAQETTWRRDWGGLLSSSERCISFFWSLSRKETLKTHQRLIWRTFLQCVSMYVCACVSYLLLYLFRASSKCFPRSAAAVLDSCKHRQMLFRFIPINILNIELWNRCQSRQTGSCQMFNDAPEMTDSVSASRKVRSPSHMVLTTIHVKTPWMQHHSPNSQEHHRHPHCTILPYICCIICSLVDVTWLWCIKSV